MTEANYPRTNKKPYHFETMPVHLRLLGIFLIYPLYFFFLSLLLRYTLIPLMLKTYWPSENAFYIYYNLVYQGILVIALVVLLHNVLLQSFHDIKVRGLGNTICWLFLGYFFFYALSTLFGIIEVLITGDSAANSQNQETINGMLSSGPAVLFLISVLLAPITEELIFRGIIFRTFRPLGSVPAILISAFLFGFQHVADYVLMGDFHEMLYMVVYFGMGLVLALIYEKRRNLLIVIGVHMIQNTLSLGLALFF